MCSDGNCVKFLENVMSSVRVDVFAAGNNCLLQEAPTSTRPQCTPSIITHKKRKEPTKKMQTNKQTESQTLNVSVKSKREPLMQKAPHMANKPVLSFFQGSADFMNSYSSSLNSSEDNNMFGTSIQSMLNVIAVLLSYSNVMKLLPKFILQNCILQLFVCQKYTIFCQQMLARNFCSVILYNVCR